MAITVDYEIVGPSSRNLLDGLGVASVLIETRLWQILHANSLFCQILQRPLKEVLEVPSLLQFIHPDDRRSHLDHTWGHLNGCVERSRFEARYVRADGSHAQVRVTMAGVKDGTGAVSWMTLVLEEVSPVADVEGDFCRIADGKVAIWEWSAEADVSGGPQRLRYLFGSGNVTRPETIEELINRVHPDDAPALESLFRRSLKGVAGTLDYRRMGEGERFHWVREMVTPIPNAAGNVSNVVGMSIDLTDARGPACVEKSAGVASLVRHIEEHWDEAIELSGLMRRYSVSARGLHQHFAALGTTAGNFLKRIRLAHARDLLSEPGDITVTEVCEKCRFGNAGHFAKDYRIEFGELPSDTLARARNRSPSSREGDWLPTEPRQAPPCSAVNVST